MSPLLRNILKMIGFFAAGLLILYLVYLNFNSAYQAQCAIDGIPSEDCNLLKKVGDDFKVVNYFWIAMVFVAFTLSNISRTMKWKLLLAPMGYKVSGFNAFMTIMLGYFANLGLPRMGEVVRAGAMAKYENIPMEEVVGTVFIDRATDLVMMALIVILSLVFQYELIATFLSENAEFAMGWTGFLLFLLILAFGGVLAYYGFVILRKFKPNFADRIIAFGKGVLVGIKSIKNVKKPVWFIFHSALIWVMFFLMTWLAFFSFGPTSSLGVPAALMVFTLGSLGMLIPTPGGMGSFHYLAVVALGLYGVNSADGFSFANIVFFSVQLGCNVTLGLLALILLPIVNKDKVVSESGVFEEILKEENKNGSQGETERTSQ